MGKTLLELSEASLHLVVHHPAKCIWEAEIPERGATTPSFSWEKGEEELLKLAPSAEVFVPHLHCHPLFSGHLWFMVREPMYAVLRKGSINHLLSSVLG